jgi:hypothetical protein
MRPRFCLALDAGLARADNSLPEPGEGDRAEPEQLSRQDVISGMSAIKPAVAACFADGAPRGVYSVQFVIFPGGGVKQARAVGPMKDTPAARCVEAAVRGAKFPRFRGPPMSIIYPFVNPPALRQARRADDDLCLCTLLSTAAP